MHYVTRFIAHQSIRLCCNEVYCTRQLGITTAPQTRRIKRNPVLADGYKGITILVTPGGRQRTGVLRVDLVPLWLTGISTNAVKDEIWPKLERFQREAAKVLWEAFQEGRLTADPSFDELLETDSQAAQAYKTILALTKLARSQLILESKVEDHEKRLEQIEATLGDTGRNITPDQASQLSQAIKTIAMKLSERSGRNEYGGVYGEVYRRFEITSYKLLPSGKFEKVMEFLADWHNKISKK
jgi:P22_AR N-terminal domain/ORF6C domain